MILNKGLYVIGDPSLFLDPKDYRKLLNVIREINNYSKTPITGGISPNDDHTSEFAWFAVNPGVYMDQFNYEYYIKSNHIACMPVEMLTHLVDLNEENAIYFRHEFRPHNNNGLIHFDHIQVNTNP